MFYGRQYNWLEQSEQVRDEGTERWSEGARQTVQNFVNEYQECGFFFFFLVHEKPLESHELRGEGTDLVSKGRIRATREQAAAGILARGNSGLDQGGNSGNSEKF